MTAASAERETVLQILEDMQACGSWDHATMKRVIENVRAALASVPAAKVEVKPAAEEMVKSWRRVAEKLEEEKRRLNASVEKMTRAVKAANVYYGCYVQDEAEEIECCISPEHHEAAKELRDALHEAVTALPSTESNRG